MSKPYTTQSDVEDALVTVSRVLEWLSGDDLKTLVKSLRLLLLRARLRLEEQR